MGRTRSIHKLFSGRIRFILYLDFDEMRELRVGLISSHWWIYLNVALSMFSTTNALPWSAIVNATTFWREQKGYIIEAYILIDKEFINFTH